MSTSTYRVETVRLSQFSEDSASDAFFALPEEIRRKYPTPIDARGRWWLVIPLDTQGGASEIRGQRG